MTVDQGSGVVDGVQMGWYTVVSGGVGTMAFSIIPVDDDERDRVVMCVCVCIYVRMYTYIYICVGVL